jgi:hypothetical protein
MTQTYNIYCDESCHLEHDRHKVMILGAVWCPLEKVRGISDRIREIKAEHGLPPTFEIKWTKVSPAKVRFYLDVMDHFFTDDDLYFRALIVPDKSLLQHHPYGPTHDDWYYKLYFDMLKVILRPDAQFRIYIDIKDTRSGDKVAKLGDILRDNLYDYSRDILQRVQIVRSHEVQILQLADLLIGTVSYANRGSATSTAKLALVEHMRDRSGYTLLRTTLFREDKTNLFVWHAS